MQQYLHKSPLSTLLDSLGLRLLILLGSAAWFIYLWGLTIPALLAGAALSILGQMALTQARRHTVHRREKALRCRLGGEMFLEEILLAPPRQAHFQTALLLGERYPLTMHRVTDSGMLCQSGEDMLLVSCVAVPEKTEVGQGQLLSIQRACRELGAERGVACVTGKVSPQTQAWAAQGVIPVKIIPRDTLVHLAGQLCPATDEQLVALGQRRKRPAPRGVRRTVLRRDKAKRYWVYGVGMLMMYLLTGLGYYPLPGVVCLVLCVGSRMAREGEETL